MFNAKKRQIEELQYLLGQLTRAAESAIDRIENDELTIDELKDEVLQTGYSVVALTDELNAKNIVVEGALAKVKVLEAANATAQEYVQKAQVMIMDLAEDLAELETERNDLAALVDEYESIGDDVEYPEKYDPTEVPFA